MKVNRLMAVALGAALVVASSCAQDDAVNLSNSVPSEVLSALDAAGFNSADVVTFHEADPIAGERKGYMLGGDIFLSEEQVFDLQNSQVIPGAEQYRTTNLVSSPRTISVCGLSGYGGGYDLTTVMRQGLQYAVDNYNALNIGLNFTLTFTSNFSNYDITVYNNQQSGAGGSAGFPTSSGNPYNFVQILAGMNNYSNQVNEHVMTHEIGHCVGFRHTDYFNRSISCGSGGNEGSSGVGAIHIPGTQTGASNYSIMLACFNSSSIDSSTKGEFSNEDKTALNYMY